MRTLSLVAAILVALAAAPAAYALGFGEIELGSALDQPLRAEIPLLAVKPSEREQVSVEIASENTFKRFGIQRPAVLDNIQVKLVPGSSDTRMRAVLTTRKPIKEPFLTFLLEANWPEGRAIREYTVLLDPPVSPPATPAEPTAPSAPQAMPSTPSAAAASGATAQTRPAAASKQKHAAVSPPAAETGARPSAHRYGPITANETLWSIAAKLRPEPGITMDQMLLALYQANPQAFDDNMNLMRKGAVLNVPDTAEIRSIDAAAADQEVAEQKTAYRRMQRARPSPQGPAAKETATAPGAAGEQTQGRLRLEPAQEEAPAAQAGGGQQPGEQAQPGREAAGTGGPAGGTQSEQGLETLASASKQPQKQQPQAQQNESTAAEAGGETTQQGSAEQTQAMQTPAPGEAATGESETGGPGQAKAGGAETAEAETEASGAPSPAESETRPPEQLAAAAGAGQATGAEAAPTSGAEPQEQAEPTAGEAEQSEPPSQEGILPNQAVGATQAVVPEAVNGLVTPRRVLLALATLLLIVALVMWMRRRQYKPVPADFPSQTAEPMDIFPATTGTAEPAPAAAAATAPPAGDAGPAPAAATEVDVDEVLEDADSHMAFELYDEAVGALQIGLEHHPGHPALQRKLLEVHYAAGERDAFMDKVDAYFPNPDDADPDWREVAALGRDLAPGDARFADVPPPGDAGEPEAAAEQARDEQASEPEQPDDSDLDMDLDLSDLGGPGTEAAETTMPAGDEEQPPEDGGATEPEPPQRREEPDAGLESPQPPEETDAESEPGMASAADDDTPEQTPEKTEDDAGPPELDIDLSDFDLDDEPEEVSGSDARDAGDTGASRIGAGPAAGADTPEFDISEFELEGLDIEDEPAAHEPTPDDEKPADEPSREGGVETVDLEWAEESSLDDRDDIESESAPQGAATPERSSETPSDQPPAPQEPESESDWKRPEPSLTTDSAETRAEPESAPETDAGTPSSTDPGLSLSEERADTGDQDMDLDELLVDDQSGPEDIQGDESDGDDEVETKLDLARAYLDMGEPDMATSLLEEVKEQGGPEQRREAESLLSRSG